MRTPGAEECRLRCQLCGALERDRAAVGERAFGTWVLAHVDPLFIVLVGPSTLDVLVSPRRHITNLTTTSEVTAPALSALRVVVGILRSALGAAGVSIAPTLEVGGADHVSFRVVPAGAGDRGGTADPDIETMVSHVAAAFDPARLGASP